MKRTPYILTALTVLVLLGLAGLNWVSRVDELEGMPHLLSDVVGLIRPKVWIWILGFTVAGIAIQAVERLATTHAARKSRVQRLLNQLVADILGGDAKSNRCTVFRAVRGIRTYRFLFWRLFFQDDHLHTIRDIMRVRPWGLYAFVYARDSQAKNTHSCAVFRVYRNKETDCEGIVGMVWVHGSYVLRDLNHFPPGELKRQLKGVRKLADLNPKSKVVRYARATNLTYPPSLRARERAAKHYIGTVIERIDGSATWGVLLVDSLQDDCPFPAGTAGAEFEDKFQTYARVLSTFLT